MRRPEANLAIKRSKAGNSNARDGFILLRFFFFHGVGGLVTNRRSEHVKLVGTRILQPSTVLVI